MLEFLHTSFCNPPYIHEENKHVLYSRRYDDAHGNTRGVAIGNAINLTGKGTLYSSYSSFCDDSNSNKISTPCKVLAAVSKDSKLFIVSTEGKLYYRAHALLCATIFKQTDVFVPIAFPDLVLSISMDYNKVVVRLVNDDDWVSRRGTAFTLNHT